MLALITKASNEDYYSFKNFFTMYDLVNFIEQIGRKVIISKLDNCTREIYANWYNIPHSKLIEIEIEIEIYDEYIE